jgi:hypothetical protein
MKMQKLLLLAGVSLALVSAASTSYAGFSVADYFGRYSCELHPLEGSSDKAGAVLLIYPDGGGKFTSGTLAGPANHARSRFRSGRKRLRDRVASFYFSLRRGSSLAIHCAESIAAFIGSPLCLCPSRFRNFAPSHS